MKTATQTRVEKAEMELARRRCLRDDGYVVEQVGNHYARMAIIAARIAQLSERNCYQDVKEITTELVRRIYEDYKHTFGLEPSWMEHLRVQGSAACAQSTRGDDGSNPKPDVAAQEKGKEQ